MELVVVGFGFKVVDDVLPVCGQDIFVIAVKSLVDLWRVLAYVGQPVPDIERIWRYEWLIRVE